MRSPVAPPKHGFVYPTSMIDFTTVIPSSHHPDEEGLHPLVKFHGLTIREYFAAHAPAEPQEWFNPVVPSMPKAPSEAPVFPDDFTDRAEDRNYIINLANNWRRDPCYDLAEYEVRPSDSETRAHCNALLEHMREELSFYSSQWLEYWDAHEAWKDEVAKQRLIQWPFAWAEAVLAAAEVTRG